MAIGFECKKNGNNKNQRSIEYNAILNMTPKHGIHYMSEYAKDCFLVLNNHRGQACS